MSNPEVRYTHSRYCSGNLSCPSLVYSAAGRCVLASPCCTGRGRRKSESRRRDFSGVNIEAVCSYCIEKVKGVYCTGAAVRCIRVTEVLRRTTIAVMNEQPLRYPSHPWIWITSIWLGFGMVDAAQTVFVMRSEGMHHVWVKLFVVTVLFWVPWAVATAPVVYLGRRFPPLKG